MAEVYLALLDPASNLRSEVLSNNAGAQIHLPGFYVGYTGKTAEERYEEHSYSNPLIRDFSSRLIREVTTLFGYMDQATARAAEAYLADLVRRLKFCCTSDARLGGNIIEGAAVISGRAASIPWRDAKFKLTDHGLFFGPYEKTCVTSGIDSLRRKVRRIGAAFGQTIRNGRFALNQEGQIIRKLMPPHGIAESSVFAVGVDGGEFLTHDSAIYCEDGTQIFGAGRRITPSDIVQELPEISLEQFKVLEAELTRIILRECHLTDARAI